MKMYTIDFETLPIEQFSNTVPKPVGVSIKVDNEPSHYYAWGHLNGQNNADFEQVCEMLRSINRECRFGMARMTGHNMKFDLRVMKTHCNVDIAWNGAEDSLFLAFLHNPHEPTLALKPLAKKYLGTPPEARNLMGEWLLENIAQPSGKKLSDRPGSKEFYVKYTAWAPPDLAGPYACGDTDMTKALRDQLFQYVEVSGQMEAYKRELALLPILIENEEQGVRVNGDRLDADYKYYVKYLEWLDSFIFYALGVPEFNINSSRQLLSHLLSAGIVDESKLKRTDNGEYSSASKNLKGAFVDKRFQNILRYRNQIKTCISTFMKPWLVMASKYNNLIYTSWNQVRGDVKGGAKTGRFSSTPNFMNIPKLKDDMHLLVRKDFPGYDFQPLPKMRGYIVPYESGWCLLDRDFSQQEIRIMGHFAAPPDGPGLLAKKYADDPRFDLHTYVQQVLMNRFGIFLDRDKEVKTVNFRISYGGGANGVAEALEVSAERGREIREAVLNANSDLDYLYRVTRSRDLRKEPIRTWGGRLYYTEPDRVIKGKTVNFAYKLVDYLIQGSAADCTKEAWLRIGMNTPTRRVYLQVHDEFLVSCPIESAQEEMLKIKTAMESVEFGVKMLSDGKISYENWGAMEKYDDKGGF